MKYVAVVPYVYEPYFIKFFDTLKIPIENMLFINNTEDNIGIMKSHNLGVEFMKERNADWLIVMSASVRFGEPGGLDFIKIIEENQEALMIHGAGSWKNNEGRLIKSIALGWHLTAFNKKVFENVGNWDTNFSNYGYDDTDLTLRIQKHFGKQYDLRVIPCDFKHESTAHGIQFAFNKIKSPSTPRINYFKRKWGKTPDEWQKDGYATPFNGEYSLSYYPQPKDPLSIQKNEFIILGGDKNEGE